MDHNRKKWLGSFSRSEIALFSVGNVLFYIPHMMITKMASSGLFASTGGRHVTAFELMPLFVVGNFLSMFFCFFVLKWKRHIRYVDFLGINIPRIKAHTFIWGLCTTAQIFTVVWIYSFSGISVIFATLLMKGGIILLSPLADLISRKRKRSIYWPSLVAALLSFAALIIALSDNSDISISAACVIDIVAYLGAVMLKLVMMSHWAKSGDLAERQRFLAEGQIATTLATALAVLVMGAFGAVGVGGPFGETWNGLTIVPTMGFIVAPILNGIASMGNGIFASLVLLDRRENTFCVTLVQSSSLIAGTISSFILALYLSQAMPTANKLIGTAIVLVAVAFLSYRDSVERKKIGLITQQS